MKRVTIRVPATTANLGPGFDAFGCALSLYTDVTFEETECGLEITGCDEAYTGPDNLAYVSYCAVLASLSEEIRGVKIHIDAHIPICRGLGSSAALLVAGAMGANVLRGNRLSTQGLLNITNAMEGHPDNLAPAFYGGLTASMVDNGLPVTVNFPLHPEWDFIALIPDYQAIEGLIRTTGAGFCLSGAGPTLLCITRDKKLEDKLAQKLDAITKANWTIIPLHVEFEGAKVLKAE